MHIYIIIHVYLKAKILNMQVQNLDESRKDYYKGNVMPFNVNNVDVTVAANGIYGITNGVLSGLLPSSMLEDLDIQVGYLKNDYMYIYIRIHTCYCTNSN